MRLNQVTIACRDYAASVAFYRTLGLHLIVDAPDRYARFECPTEDANDQPSTLSLHAITPDERVSGTVIYFEVVDVQATFNRLVEAGLTPQAAPTKQDWLWTECYFDDPAGNRVCIYHAGENRRFPPWRVER